MSNRTQSLQRLADAFEDARRAFGQLATEIEIADNAARQSRHDVEAGIKREAELRELLRDRGLASYDDTKRRRQNDDPGNS
jgi:hypothetical protein